MNVDPEAKFMALFSRANAKVKWFKEKKELFQVDMHILYSVILFDLIFRSCRKSSFGSYCAAIKI